MRHERQRCTMMTFHDCLAVLHCASFVAQDTKALPLRQPTEAFAGGSCASRHEDPFL
jgi:hypothetical protein